MVSPILEHELREQLDHLPLGQQQQVLDFARALVADRPHGVAGRNLIPLAGTISAPDLAAIAQAVQDCE